MGPNESYRNIPVESIPFYIAEKVSGIDKNVGIMSEKLSRLVDETGARKIANEVVEGKLKLCKLEHNQKTPKSTDVSSFRRNSIINVSDWRDVIKLIIYVLLSLGVFGGTGFAIGHSDTEVPTTKTQINP